MTPCLSNAFLPHKYPTESFCQTHRSRISSELSCLSSGLPRALLRSLLSSSMARKYSACSSPGGYVAVTNFDSGFTKSTSEDFFNGTEMNVAIRARRNSTDLAENWEHCKRTKTKAVHFLDLFAASSRHMYLKVTHAHSRALPSYASLL